MIAFFLCSQHQHAEITRIASVVGQKVEANSHRNNLLHCTVHGLEADSVDVAFWNLNAHVTR
jgi:hypothetical protein